MARADLKYIIGFETNDSDVVTATKRLNQLQQQVKYLSDQQKKGNISAAIMRKGQKQLNDEIGKLRTATQQGGQALRDYITQVDKGGKAMKRNQLAMQQAGYQVQDFIVQVQGGTNPLVAFSQQASQLAGFFAGPWGAMIGLGIAALSGLAMAFSSTGAASDELRKDIEEDVNSMLVKLRELQTGLNPNQQRLMDQLAAARAAEEEALSNRNARYETLSALGTHPNDMGMGIEDRRLEAATQAVREAEQAYASYTNTLDQLRQVEREKAQEEAANQAVAQEAIRTLEELDRQEQRAAEEAERRRKAAEDYLTALGIQITNRQHIIGLEGEELLLAQQRIERETILRQLAEGGLDIMDYEVQSMLRQLGLQHAGEIMQYRINKAREDGVKAQSEQERLDRERLARLQEEYKAVQGLTDGISKSFENAFMDIVDGTSSVKDAFRSLAADIIKQLFRVLVVQSLVGGFNWSTGEGSGIAGAIGGAIKGAKATGGPVLAGKTYLVGENGPELFTAPNNGNITPNNQMGGGVTVVQNINVSTGVQQTVRTEIRQLMPQIAESAKGAVLDAKRRGGSYGKAFA